MKQNALRHPKEAHAWKEYSIWSTIVSIDIHGSNTNLFAINVVMYVVRCSLKLGSNLTSYDVEQTFIKMT